MKYAFFPGCSMEGTAADYRLSTLAVARIFGIELPEIPDWTCCGSTAAHSTDPLLAAALPAQNLAVTKKMAVNNGPQKVAVGCAACFSRLRLANIHIAADAGFRRSVAEVTGTDYDGQTPIVHLLEILAREIGPAAIAAKILRPLKGLKVVSYYGCLLSRPPEVAFDDVENPTLMDKLMCAAGAIPLDWTHKTECCGASCSITDTDVVCELGHEILTMAKAAGADCIVTACPLCQLNLDLRQQDITGRYHESYNLPVFYFTQLLGLALGCNGRELGLDRLVVSPWPLLFRVGIPQSAR
jgi:heterodisulfide reductase subunit B2